MRYLQDMFTPADPSHGSPSSSRIFFLPGSQKGFRDVLKSRYRLSGSHNRLRVEDIYFAADSGLPQARSIDASSRPSAAKVLLQRTMAYFRRQPKPQAQVHPPQPEIPLNLAGRDGLASLTRLVLRSSDDVSFSPSSFFRRVEEVSALSARPEVPPAFPAPSLSLKPPPRPRRRPPPPVEETLAQVPPHLDSSSSLVHASLTPRKSSSKTNLDSVLELQALAMELDKRNPLDSPPFAQRQLRPSPSIKFARTCPPLSSPCPPATHGLGCDPLTELLAVAEELKTLKNLDSDDILYMTDELPLSPLPPTLHTFLDAPGPSLRILEMDVHREDETFLGVPIPCIVVTSERESLPADALATRVSPPSSSEDLLAPPIPKYRGRTEASDPLIIINDREVKGDSSSSSPSPCAAFGDDVRNSSSALCDYSNCLPSDLNLSWEDLSIVSMPPPSNQCSKPDRPTAPKPALLLRRRERSLLQRVLGNGGDRNVLPAQDKLRPGPSTKRKQKRISKEAIGAPRPLSSSSQGATVLYL
ncbi:hypothetical protein B0F90DRAFT_1819553 [Multifurca ochricompacta]|uniref:Uncharacterized protein n=1 Tax=Multifurca ochricompacta TaxID=376703 RepID=A0AAD4M273_9AGAM|nr:hypothetical protein B0F90DRAFT_1819553 [Multifurca ochricompacta]